MELSAELPRLLHTEWSSWCAPYCTGQGFCGRLDIYWCQRPSNHNINLAVVLSQLAFFERYDQVPCCDMLRHLGFCTCCARLTSVPRVTRRWWWALAGSSTGWVERSLSREALLESWVLFAGDKGKQLDNEELCVDWRAWRARPTKGKKPSEKVVLLTQWSEQ